MPSNMFPFFFASLLSLLPLLPLPVSLLPAVLSAVFVVSVDEGEGDVAGDVVEEELAVMGEEETEGDAKKSELEEWKEANGVERETDERGGRTRKRGWCTEAKEGKRWDDKLKRPLPPWRNFDFNIEESS